MNTHGDRESAACRGLGPRASGSARSAEGGRSLDRGGGGRSAEVSLPGVHVVCVSVWCVTVCVHAHMVCVSVCVWSMCAVCVCMSVSACTHHACVWCSDE